MKLIRHMWIRLWIMCIRDGFYGLNTLKMTLNTRQKGNIGEDIACKYLVNKGYLILKRNYRKVWGEIDIVLKKDNIIHFVEVKSIRVRDDYGQNNYRPEENVDNFKIGHIRRMVQTYFYENLINPNNSFAFHVICVYLNTETRKAKIKIIENIIL